MADKARQVEADAPKVQDTSLPGWVSLETPCALAAGTDTRRALGLVRVSASDAPILASWSRRPASSPRHGKTRLGRMSSSRSGPNAKRPSSSSRICRTLTRALLSTRLSSLSRSAASGTAGPCIRRRRCRESSRRREQSSNPSDACSDVGQWEQAGQLRNLD